MGSNPASAEHEEPVPGLSDAADAIARRSRAARLRRGLLVSVFTLAALSVVFEVGLRATSFRRRTFEATVNKTIRRWVELTTAGIFEELDDPVRRYRMRPGAEVSIDGWSFRVTRHGTRGEDFPLEKPPGEKRILALGDSYCFGMWCDDDRTLVGHLARLANEREEERGSTTTWRAVNLGVPGYHTTQQVRAFEQDGLPLDPDVVVVYFNTNDIEREGFFYDEELGVLRRDFLPLPTGLRRVLWNSHLYGWIVLQHRRLVDAGPAPHMDPAVPYAFVREDNQSATRAALERLRDLCRERDVELFFVHMPHLTWQGSIQSPDWEMLPLHRWAEDVRADLGIPGVDLLGLMRGWSDGVDRTGEPEPGTPRDFLLDTYVADERIEAAVTWAREEATARGLAWEELDYAAKFELFGGYPGEIPAVPDFHLDGEGYGHLARVSYAALSAQGLLP